LLFSRLDKFLGIAVFPGENARVASLGRAQGRSGNEDWQLEIPSLPKPNISNKLGVFLDFSYPIHKLCQLCRLRA
jgi:hypothetical protein